MNQTWRLRVRTAEAAARLVWARALIELIPFSWWRRWLGSCAPNGPSPPTAPAPADPVEARRLARHVDRAAARLSFPVKCLPRAIALAGMLRRRRVSYALVLAARPLKQRTGHDDLHAWVDVCGEVVIGDLPGPWLRVLVLTFR